MTINNAVSAMAGVIVIISLLLGSEVITSAFFHDANWLWLTGFVGFNLLQSAFTGFCPAAMIFKAMGLKN